MKSLVTLIIFLAGALVVVAQTPIPISTPLPPSPPLPRGTTTLVLGADVVNGVVAPGGGSRVCVPPGESVTLMAPLQ